MSDSPRQKGRRLKSTKLEMKREVTTHNMETQNITRDYYKQLHTNKMDSLEQMDRYLEKFNLPRLSQKETEIIDKSITDNEIKTVIKNIPKNNSPGPNGFTRELHQMFREDLISILLKLFQKISEEGILSNSFHETTITKIRQRNHRKRKLQTSLMNIDAKILKKILASRIQQHMKRIIYHDQVGFIQGMQGFFNICKSNNVIHHINQLKAKNHMIISTDTEKAFNKIQHLFMIKKKLFKNGHRRNLSQHSKGHI